MYRSARFTPEKFKNAALFFPLDLLSALIRHKTDIFNWKRSSNRKNLGTLAFSFSCWTKNILKMELFANYVVTVIPCGVFKQI